MNSTVFICALYVSAPPALILIFNNSSWIACNLCPHSRSTKATFLEVLLWHSKIRPVYFVGVYFLTRPSGDLGTILSALTRFSRNCSTN